jgi:hypothetical protein
MGISVKYYMSFYIIFFLNPFHKSLEQASKYPDSVATTWSLSFQKVEQAHPAAADLLQLCAFLAGYRHQVITFTEGMDHPELLFQKFTKWGCR